jgi:predicted nucleotidyltransferase
MNDIHKNLSQESSVEQNLSENYISKTGQKIPKQIPLNNNLSTDQKKEQEKLQKKINNFKTEATKKYKFIEAIGIIPKASSKKIEEEYEIPESEAKRNLDHILVIVPEKHFKKITQIRLDIVNIAKKIDGQFWVHVMTPVDIWNLGLDSKYEIFEAISMAYPVLDKGVLASLRVSQIHKSMVLRKFEKYVTSYVIYGSLTRGEATKTSDVDISIIIDDTDVKRMSRLELKEKLRGIISSYIQEAQAMAGVKNILNVQVWLLTEFWDGVKDAHPVFFTFIRDGVPLYDRGTFLPWKTLLRMGKIKPSPEAIDMFMAGGAKLKETVDKRIFDIATLDLFWNISTPTQGLLMLYGLAPTTPKETLKLFKEIFYEKEKLVEKKYVDILDEIMIKVWKGYEHGKIKPGDIDGIELNRLANNAFDYIKRIQELREQIEKRVQEKSIEQVYKEVFKMLEAILNKKSESAIIKEFENNYIKQGKFPQKFLENLKFIAKVKRDLDKKDSKNTKSKIKKKENKKTSLTGKQFRNVEDAKRFASEITKALMEYTQRCDFLSMEKSRYVIRGRDAKAEVFFLEHTFLIQGPKIQKIVNSKVKDSGLEDLQRELASSQGKETRINLSDLEILRKMFGEFDLVQ